MAARSIHVTELRELIRLLRKGETDRRIARDLGLSHNTVAKYRSWALGHELLGATLPSESFLRLEVGPGDEAPVDFGYAGGLHDSTRGTARRAWVFVMTLSHGSHGYAEIVFHQSVETWTRLHVSAFEFFGGVPRQIASTISRPASSRRVSTIPRCSAAIATLRSTTTS